MTRFTSWLRQFARTALGRQMLGPTVFGLSLLISLGVRVVGLPQDAALSLAQHVLVTFIAHCLSYLWLWLVTMPLATRGGEKLLWVALASVFVIGAIRGVTVDYLVNQFSNHDAGLLLTRIAGSTTITGLGLLAVSYAAGVWQLRVQSVEQLRAAQSQLEQALASNRQAIEKWHGNLVKDVQQRLERELAEKLAAGNGSLSAGLQQSVVELIRPLSHDLMFESPGEIEPASKTRIRKTNWRELAREASATNWRVLPLANVLLSLAATLPIFSQSGPHLQVWQYFPTLALLWLLLWVAGRFFGKIQLDRSPAFRLWAFASLVIAATYLPSLLGLQFVSYFDGVQGWFRALLFALVEALVALAVSLADAMQRALRNDQKQLEAANQKLRWLVAHTRAQMWERQRELSQLVHGPIQTAVAAAAIRLDLAGNDQAKMNEAAQVARQTIVAAVASLTNSQEVALQIRSGFAKVRAGWQGVAEVTLDCSRQVESQLNVDSSTARVTLDICQEAVANAIRHGRASTVNVKIDAPMERVLSIVVQNNGLPLPTETESGLGTKLLNDCALDWRRWSDAQGTWLRCELPLGS